MKVWGIGSDGRMPVLHADWYPDPLILCNCPVVGLHTHTHTHTLADTTEPLCSVTMTGISRILAAATWIEWNSQYNWSICLKPLIVNFMFQTKNFICYHMCLIFLELVECSIRVFQYLIDLNLLLHQNDRIIMKTWISHVSFIYKLTCLL